MLLHGRLDVLWRDGPRALVLDYKTNSLARARRPTRSSRTTTGCSGSSTRSRASGRVPTRSRSSTTFLERPDAVVSTTFRRDELPALEAELSAAIARIDAGEFMPTPSEFNCTGCPALDLVCAGPKLRNLPPRLVATA